jgi:hypothetical protein
MTMKRPLILLLGISSTTAYSTNMSPSLDVVSFAQTLRVASTSTIMEQNRSLLESRMSKPYKVSYDLGIGRNFPFVSKGQQGEAQRERKSRDQSVFHHATVEFWNEHQAVRDLPDPGRRTPSVKAARKGSKVKQIVPNRLAIDALAIMEYDEYLGETKASGSSSFSRAQNGPHPIMTVAGSFSVRNLDVNTPWVEMLIHEQQQKLKLQAS